MIKKCPYCEKPLDMADVLESGQYICPYDDCSKTFFYNKDEGNLHKIEEPTEEILEDKIVIVCPNPDCRQKLSIPKTKNTLRVTCPKCRTSFGYPAQGEEAEHDIRGLLAEFDKALEDEIKAVKTRGGDRVLVLKDGKFIGEIAGGRVYQFNVERKIPVTDETPAQIEIMGRNYRASIIRFLLFRLDVRIEGFEDEQIPVARLKIDATYVLRKLKDALSLLAHGFRNTDLALKVFNRIPSKCTVGKHVFDLMDKERQFLDPFQEKALEVCLGNEVSFIQGPPGTGKTKTLVNAVNEFANNGKKVLVSCHTNIACDNVIEHFVRYEHEKAVGDMLYNWEIIRIGTPVTTDESVKDYTVEAIYERLSKKLEKEKERLTTLLSSLVEKKRKYAEYQRIFLESQKIVEKMATCKENISTSKRAIKQYILEEGKFNQIINEHRQLLSAAERRNAIINFLKRTKPENIRLTIANLNHGKMEEIRNRLKEEKRLRLLSDNLEKLNSSLSKRLGNLPEGIEKRQTESILMKTEKGLEEAKAQIVDIDDKVSRLRKGILDNARVIVSTLAKTFTDPILMNMQFDVVTIDEASIAPLPMLFYVCSLAGEKVLIFGDRKQLAPVKLAGTVAAEKWLKKDIFQEAAAREDNPYDLRIKSLNYHYRMHEEIFEIVNNNFYEGKLCDRRPEVDREYNKYSNLIPKPGCRVVIIDTSNANACSLAEKTGRKSWSRYNLYHIQIVEKILHDLVDGNYVTQDEIGIVTPYRSQASFIREVLMESEFKDVGLGTVHTFQGLEKKYVIFDLVEALGGRGIGYLVNDKHRKYSSKGGRENAALRLLTVAFSRPKEKLLIISHVKHMLGNLPRNSVIRKIITDLIKREAIVDGSKFVPYYVPVEQYPDAALFDEEELLDKEAVFNQRSFYPHLIQDLENARKDVIFISGYMSINRIDKLMPHFTNLLSRGVNVKIVTKPPREQVSRKQELEELHHGLTNIGIEIYQHYRTHEKVVTIDGHILYMGSLNVLSFNHGSNEMMVRSDSKRKLQKVFSVLVKNHPRLEDYLIKTGYVVPEQPVDLTPEKFQDILDAVRPKNKKLPKKKEAKKYYRSMLKKLRWPIVGDKRLPYQAVLFSETIEALLNDPPTTVEQLLSLPEFRRNRTNIRGYENIALKILREYTEVIGKDKEA
jgi:superfamily I DNA and/or RNA helicase